VDKGEKVSGLLLKVVQGLLDFSCAVLLVHRTSAVLLRREQKWWMQPSAG